MGWGTVIERLHTLYCGMNTWLPSLRTVLLMSTLGLGLLLNACSLNRIDEQSKEFSEKGWAIRDTAVFATTLPEGQAGTFLIKARTASNYPFSNLYVRVIITDGQGRQLLSELHELLVSHPETGKPYGSGLGDAFDVQATAYKKLKLPGGPNYKVKLVQYMRRDPLEGVLSIGFRTEN